MGRYDSTLSIGTQRPAREASLAHRACYLLIAHGDSARVVELKARDTLTIGRGDRADIVIDDPLLSRVHAQVQRAGRGAWIEDMASRNGTAVNGRPTTRTQLTAGDVASLAGAVTLRVDQAIERRQPEERAQPSPITGSATRALFDQVERIAPADIGILLQGETGSGKEVVAAHIHHRSGRRGPFVPVNCGAIPGELVEAFLFGHAAGAFTGAASDRRGVFEEAQGGTVFLDEIGEMPLAAQVALLRVLESRQVRPVGGSAYRPVDVRVVAATHRDLQEAARQGRFREDLYYRINAAVLRVPPLRERRDEILPLAKHFLTLCASEQEIEAPVVSAEAAHALTGYHWPGNARELRNVMERALVLGDGDVVVVADLPGHIVPVSDATAPERLDDALLHREVELLLSALVAAGGKRPRAASLLGIPRRTLDHKVAHYGLSARVQEAVAQGYPPPLAGAIDLRALLAKCERELLEAALQTAPLDAARILGVRWRRIRTLAGRYGLEDLIPPERRIS